MEASQKQPSNWSTGLNFLHVCKWQILFRPGAQRLHVQSSPSGIKPHSSGTFWNCMVRDLIADGLGTPKTQIIKGRKDMFPHFPTKNQPDSQP